MTTIIVPVQPPSPPKCPHCRVELPGWTPPNNDQPTAGEMVRWTAIFLLGCAWITAFIVGWIDGAGVYRCGPWPSSVASLVMPTHALGCRVGQWFTAPIWSDR